MAFSFFNNYFLTIDIGFRQIKILQIRKKENNGIEVVNFAIGKTPRDCIKNGAIKDTEKVIEEIKKIMLENNITAKEAKIVMSGTNIITRIIMIESVPESKIEEKVMQKIESFMPINLEEHSVDFKILDYINIGGEKKIRVLITAVKKSIINSYIEIIKSLNLKPLSVDTPANSISKLFQKDINLIESEYMGRERNLRIDSGTIAVLDFGSETTIVNILKNKVLEFNRVILIGSTNVDKAILDNVIADKTKVDLAEQYKKRYGIVARRDFNDDLEWNCSEATKIAINTIIKNINACFEYYISRCGGEKVSRIFIIGGGSQLKGLKEYLEVVFKLPCYCISVLEISGVGFAEKLDINRSNFLLNALGIAF